VLSLHREEKGEKERQLSSPATAAAAAAGSFRGPDERSAVATEGESGEEKCIALQSSLVDDCVWSIFVLKKFILSYL